MRRYIILVTAFSVAVLFLFLSSCTEKSSSEDTANPQNISESVNSSEAATSDYSEIADINIAVDEESISGSYRGKINPVFKGDTALFTADGWNYGYIDLTGNWIVPAEYTLRSSYFLGDYALVDKTWTPGNGGTYSASYGLIDKKGNVVLPLEYSYISSYDGSYFNEYGFTVAGKYTDNWNERYGAVDKNNNIVIPFDYEFIEKFIDGKAQAKKDGKDIILDIYGNETVLEPDNSGYTIVSQWQEKTNTIKYGLADAEGNLILPYEYDNIWYWKDSLFITRKDGANYSSSGSVIDAATGKILAESSDGIYPYEAYDEKSDLLILNRGEPYGSSKKGISKYGAINLTTGETVIPFEYDLLTGINDGIIAAAKDGKVGFIDEKNNIVLPFVHEGTFISAGRFINDRVIIYSEKYDLIIDKNNNVIYKSDLYRLQFMSKFIDHKEIFYNYIVFYGRNNNLDACGVMDMNGNIIIPMKYSFSDMQVIADKYFLCGIYDGKGGFAYTIYDLKGNKISKEEYNIAAYLEQTDSFVVYIGDSQGVIDSKGNYILPPNYDFINGVYHEDTEDYHIDDVITTKDITTGKYGYISSSSWKIIVPMIFDYACTIGDDGYAIVKQDEQWKIIRINAVITK